MKITTDYTDLDPHDTMFALIRAAESGTAAGKYDLIVHDKKGPGAAYGAYQLRAIALQQINAIGTSITDWTGNYGDSLASFRENQTDQDDAAAAYANDRANFINNHFAETIGTTFTNDFGVDVPLTEDGAILATWYRPAAASRMAHGQNINQLKSGLNITDSDCLDVLSRFEAGAIVEGLNVENPTDQAVRIATQVEDYESSLDKKKTASFSYHGQDFTSFANSSSELDGYVSANATINNYQANYTGSIGTDYSNDVPYISSASIGVNGNNSLITDDGTESMYLLNGQIYGWDLINNNHTDQNLTGRISTDSADSSGEYDYANLLINGIDHHGGSYVRGNWTIIST